MAAAAEQVTGSSWWWLNALLREPGASLPVYPTHGETVEPLFSCDARGQGSRLGTAPSFCWSQLVTALVRALTLINFQQHHYLFSTFPTHALYKLDYPPEVYLEKLGACLLCTWFVCTYSSNCHSFGLFASIVLPLLHRAASRVCTVMSCSLCSGLLWFPLTVCCYTQIFPEGSIKFHLMVSIDVYCRGLINLAR